MLKFNNFLIIACYNLSMIARDPLDSFSPADREAVLEAAKNILQLTQQRQARLLNPYMDGENVEMFMRNPHIEAELNKAVKQISSAMKDDITNIIGKRNDETASMEAVEQPLKKLMGAFEKAGSGNNNVVGNQLSNKLFEKLSKEVFKQALTQGAQQLLGGVVPSDLSKVMTAIDLYDPKREMQQGRKKDKAVSIFSEVSNAALGGVAPTNQGVHRVADIFRDPHSKI